MVYLQPTVLKSTKHLLLLMNVVEWHTLATTFIIVHLQRVGIFVIFLIFKPTDPTALRTIQLCLQNSKICSTSYVISITTDNLLSIVPHSWQFLTALCYLWFCFSTAVNSIATDNLFSFVPHSWQFLTDLCLLGYCFTTAGNSITTDNLLIFVPHSSKFLTGLCRLGLWQQILVFVKF